MGIILDIFIHIYTDDTDFVLPKILADLGDYGITISYEDWNLRNPLPWSKRWWKQVTDQIKAKIDESLEKASGNMPMGF